MTSAVMGGAAVQLEEIESCVLENCTGGCPESPFESKSSVLEISKAQLLLFRKLKDQLWCCL